MTAPTFAQLSNPASGGPGFGPENYAQRLVTIWSILASGQNPDGTPQPSFANAIVPTAFTTDAINAAVTVAATPGTPAAYVQLKAGTYLQTVTAPNIIPQAGVKIRAGYTYGTTIQGIAGLTGGNADLFRVVIGTGSTYMEGFSVEGLMMDCSACTAGNGMTLQGVNDLDLRDIVIIKPYAWGVIHGSVGGLAPYIQRPRFSNVMVLGERNGNDSFGGGGVAYGLYEDLKVFDAPGGGYVVGTGWDLTNLNTCTISRMIAVTANPSPTTGGICSDFGTVNCTFDECTTGGFKFGFLFTSAAGQTNHSWLTLSNPRVLSSLDNAIFFNSAPGLGPTHLTIEDPKIVAWDSSGNGTQAINLQGAVGFEIRGGSIGTGGGSGAAIRLDTDGTNPSNHGTINSVDLSSGAGIIYSSVGSDIKVTNNPGYNPVGTLTPAVPSSGSPVTPVYPYDTVYFVKTTAGTTSCSLAIQNGATITLVPSTAQVVPVPVPAGLSVTPTYTGTAPTWTVQGD